MQQKLNKKRGFSNDFKKKKKMGGIMWWATGHFDQSGDEAWKFSKRWLPEAPASPDIHKMIEIFQFS